MFDLTVIFPPSILCHPRPQSTAISLYEIEVSTFGQLFLQTKNVIITGIITDPGWCAFPEALGGLLCAIGGSPCMVGYLSPKKQHVL